jgi:hypothetical protein
MFTTPKLHVNTFGKICMAEPNVKIDVAEEAGGDRSLVIVCKVLE